MSTVSGPPRLDFRIRPVAAFDPRGWQCIIGRLLRPPIYELLPKLLCTPRQFEGRKVRRMRGIVCRPCGMAAVGAKGSQGTCFNLAVRFGWSTDHSCIGSTGVCSEAWIKWRTSFRRACACVPRCRICGHSCAKLTRKNPCSIGLSSASIHTDTAQRRLRNLQVATTNSREYMRGQRSTSLRPLWAQSGPRGKASSLVKPTSSRLPNLDHRCAVNFGPVRIRRSVELKNYPVTTARFPACAWRLIGHFVPRQRCKSLNF